MTYKGISSFKFIILYLEQVIRELFMIFARVSLCECAKVTLLCLMVSTNRTSLRIKTDKKKCNTETHTMVYVWPIEMLLHYWAPNLALTKAT